MVSRIHLLLVSSFLMSNVAFAADYHGRASVGGYFAKERFAEADSGGTKSNDSALASVRMYLDASRLTSKRFRILVDVRDKNDLFGEIDKDKLELKSKNTLQIRQLNLQLPNNYGKYYFSLGRFQAFDSGVVYVDGAEVGFRMTAAFRAGVFGGNNPKSDRDHALQTQTEGKVFGGFGIYQSASRSWYDYSYSSTAIIDSTDEAVPEEEVQSAETGSNGANGAYARTYIYNNTILQFSRDSRLLALVYFDIAPEADLQNLWLSYYRKLGPRLTATVSGSDIHANEYRKIQETREKLKPSSYKQFKITAGYRVARPTKIVVKALSGKRDIDNLDRSEYSGGLQFSRLISSKFAGSIIAGVRKKFTNNDVFYRIGLGRYSRKTELTFDYEGATETKFSGEKLHPTIIEASLGFILSRKFFGSFAVQQAKDEKVNIVSGLLRVSSRFGNKEIPPVRDGAPPKGRL